MDFFKESIWKLNLVHYNLKKSLHELKSVSVEITNFCNLNCKHCYLGSEKEKNLSKEIDFEDWVKFFDSLKADFGTKVFIQITGGEAFLRKDIFDILDHLNRLGFRVAVVSNGLLLNDKNVDKLKERIVSLSISLDGFKESHNYLRSGDVFDSVVSNIKNIRDKNIIDLTIKTTVFKNNFSELKDFYIFLKGLKINTWHLFAMEPKGSGEINKKDVISKEEYKKLCEFVDGIRKIDDGKMRIIFEEQPTFFMGLKTFELNNYKICEAGISSCSILSNGDVVDCVQGNRGVVYANIKEKTLKKIWEKGFKENRLKKYRCCRKHYFSNSNKLKK